MKNKPEPHISFLFKVLFFIFPIKKDLILLWSRKASKPNLIYLHQYLGKNHPKKYDLIWVIEKNQVSIESPLPKKSVVTGTLRFYYYLIRAKCILITHHNIRIPSLVNPKSIFINLWHGSPIKKVGNDVIDPELVSRMGGDLTNIARWDYVISASEETRFPFESAFNIKKEQILPYGLPRTDIIYQAKACLETSISIKQKIMKTLNLSKNKKMTLYLPTFRDTVIIHEVLSITRFLYDWKRTKNNEILIVKFHPEVKKQYTDLIDLHSENIIILSDPFYIDLQELLIAGDQLISDYSSVVFDFSILEKPVFLYTYDLEIYKKNMRGFYYDFEKLMSGYAICSTTTDLFEKLQTPECYCNKGFYKEFNSENASKTLCTFLSTI